MRNEKAEEEVAAESSAKSEVLKLFLSLKRAYLDLHLEYKELLYLNNEKTNIQLKTGK